MEHVVAQVRETKWHADRVIEGHDRDSTSNEKLEKILAAQRSAVWHCISSQNFFIDTRFGFYGCSQ